MLSHLLDLEPFGLFVVAVGVVVLFHVIAGWTLWSQFLLVDVGVGLCLGGAIATAALLVCFAIGVPMAVPKRLLMHAEIGRNVGDPTAGLKHQPHGALSLTTSVLRAADPTPADSSDRPDPR